MTDGRAVILKTENSPYISATERDRILYEHADCDYKPCGMLKFAHFEMKFKITEGRHIENGQLIKTANMNIKTSQFTKPCKDESQNYNNKYNKI